MCVKYKILGNFITRYPDKSSIFKNNIFRLITNRVEHFLMRLALFISHTFSKKQEYKYNICICAIFKNESIFLKEWINFHILIGVDHFYLYNNNSDDDYKEILKPFIDNNIVTLIDWPHDQPQMKAYQHCYKTTRKLTQWLTFIDIDEFICPNSVDNIKDWLRKYKTYHSVAVYWTQFGSSGIINHDKSKTVIEQYVHCWPKLSTYTKMICNMDYPIKELDNPHVLRSNILGMNFAPINIYGQSIAYNFHIKSNSKSTDSIQLNHYWNKGYDVFYKNKIQRSDVYHKDHNEMSQIRMNLLKSHEFMCTGCDYNIHKYLLSLKTMLLNSTR